MIHLRSLLLTLLAVLALMSPPLAVAVGAAATGDATVTTADDAGEPEFRPCTKQSGKRALPCPPEMGVLLWASEQQLWSRAPAPRLAPDLRLPERAPETDPPPPRRG